MFSGSKNVLVLNLDYQPINICGTRRAVKLIFLGKAEIIEHNGKQLVSPGFIIPQPSVIKLSNFIKRPQPQIKLSRKAIFARDGYRCQYCGRRGVKMTIDHVIPRGLGGEFVWENLVCACQACNMKKGDRLPSDAGMKLIRQPFRPSWIPFISYALYNKSVETEQWRKYLPEKLYG